VADERLLLELADSVLDLLDDRAVVFHHRVHDAVEQRDRALFQNVLVAAADVAHLFNRARFAVVHGHQVVPAEKEIDVPGRELRALRPAVACRLRRGQRGVDAVEHEIEVAGIAFDFGELQRADGVFDRQRVEAKHLEQEPALFVTRRRQIDPDGDVR